MTEVGEYLERQKVEYNFKNRLDLNDTEWAEYLGATAQLYSNWTNAGKTPSPQYMRKIALKLGLDIYKISDKPIPEDLEPFSSLPPELFVAILSTNKRIASLGLPVDFSASLKILAEEIKPFGFTTTSSTDKDGSTK